MHCHWLQPQQINQSAAVNYYKAITTTNHTTVHCKTCFDWLLPPPLTPFTTQKPSYLIDKFKFSQH